jgi:hypothetical protein
LRDILTAVGLQRCWSPHLSLARIAAYGAWTAVLCQTANWPFILALGCIAWKRSLGLAGTGTPWVGERLTLLQPSRRDGRCHACVSDSASRWTPCTPGSVDILMNQHRSTERHVRVLSAPHMLNAQSLVYPGHRRLQARPMSALTWGQVPQLGGVRPGLKRLPEIATIRGVVAYHMHGTAETPLPLTSAGGWWS